MIENVQGDYQDEFVVLQINGALIQSQDHTVLLSIDIYEQSSEYGETEGAGERKTR